MINHIQKIRTINSQKGERINTINGIQGAVTQNGFKVVLKMSKPNKSVYINLYSDSLKTNLVLTTTESIADSLGYASIEIQTLTPNTKYYWVAMHNGVRTSIAGQIKTLPSGNASFNIVAGSCAVGPQIAGPDFRYSNHEIFRHLANYRADEIALMWHIGDIHYQDVASLEVKPYCDAYDGVLRQSNQQDLYLKTSLLYMWDDHDFTGNNSNGGKNLPQSKAALEAYRKRFPHYPTPLNGDNAPVCHSIMIGRVLLINLDCRSQKDKHAGTILGTDQKIWLKDLMLTTTAKAFIINVSVPWISSSGGDMWGSVPLERQELMDFWATNGLDGKIILLAGDAHMVAIDNGTNNSGIPVFQFSAFDSPATFKGGPYSEGSTLGMYQYGMFKIEDKGDSIDITGSAYKVVGGLSQQLPQLYKKTILI